ncbi:DnaA N-terminal domain-containing protein [Anaerobacillus sp. MEB173]|uniref:DnaA N-terminal domain-containing protein n=1 Tax=Anaerobacillus sp. MEB173 TaxID=3383345 RepID=UPI003F8F4E0B
MNENTINNLIKELKDMKEDLQRKDKRIADILELLEKQRKNEPIGEDKWDIENDTDELLHKVLNAVKSKISRPSYQTWFTNITMTLDEEILTIISENEFQCDWLENRYRTLIEEIVEEITGQKLIIKFKSSN